jgi:Cu2+-containing amine oxidase
MNLEEESRKALKTTFEWDLEYKRPGAGTISERLPADSVPEVFKKSGFNLAEDHDFRARKVWVVEYHNHTKNFFPEGEWINYSPPPSD